MPGYTDFALFYDELQKSVNYAEIADYYDGLIKKFGADDRERLTLDLACGTGKFTRLFAQKGYDMIATDASETMLGFAVKNSVKAKIQYLRQNMTELDMFGTLDNVVCVLDGINHLDGIGGVSAAFEKVSLFMNPGGLFVFDVNTLYKHKNVLGCNAFVIESGNLFTVWRNYYAGGGRVDIELDFFAEEKGNTVYKRYCDAFSETAYELDLIKEKLAAAGFEVVGCFDWLSEKAPRRDSEKAVFVAVKK